MKTDSDYLTTGLPGLVSFEKTDSDYRIRISLKFKLMPTYAIGYRILNAILVIS